MKRIAIAAVAALLCCGCGREPLVILHVNDTHSHLEAARDDARGGIIERGAIVDSVRAAHGAENVLLLHAGDFNQGSSYYTRFGGEAELAAFNAFGYDCLTLGNHEFDNGTEDLAARLARINCPVVCANVDCSATALAPYVQPCAVLHKAGRTIGIIGAAPDLSTNISSSARKGLVQLDLVQTVNDCSAKLAPKCDLVILLSHLGYDEDQRLAPMLRGVDLIVGGHSHTFVDDFITVKDADGKPVRIITDGCWGLNIGEITIN